jgi:glycolate oxidase
MGRISPHLVVQDAVVPRTKLPAVLAEIHRIGEAYRVKVCNVFHAGDGNLHPNIGYDATSADESERVHRAMSEIMQACIDAGGTITGEHGVGRLKRPWLAGYLGPDVMELNQLIKTALDPQNILNPGAVFADP